MALVHPPPAFESLEHSSHPQRDNLPEDVHTCLHGTACSTVSSVKAKIASAASRNSELLVTLESTSEAPAALGHISTHISILQNEVSKQDQALQEIMERVALKFKQHKKYRDSVTKRFTYRLTNMKAKFDDKAMKEEQEYNEALEAQHKAEERKNLLQDKVHEAVKERSGLEAAAKTHDETHKQIDSLYESIFAGPTPGFQTEDDREQNYYSALRAHEVAKTAVASKKRAVQHLNRASSTLKQAQSRNRRAQEEAKHGLILALSGAFSFLKEADHYATLTLVHADQALEGLQPLDFNSVEAKTLLQSRIKAASIERGSVSSKQAMLERSAEAEQKFSEAEEALDTLVNAAKQKERAAREEVRGTARTLEDARQALQQIRQAAFEQVVGFGAAPPAYHECCDRAKAFEEVSDEEIADNEDGDMQANVEGEQDDEVHQDRSVRNDLDLSQLPTQTEPEQEQAI